MTIQKDPEGNELRLLSQYADFKDKRVLEVGCGEGRLTWKYAPAARGVVGLDLEHDSLRVASIERPSDLAERLLFARADSTHLPLPAREFDIALLAWSL
jgi:ubiquinone/menaquinone biosynthesis C-methylase UbiE